MAGEGGPAHDGIGGSGRSRRAHHPAHPSARREGPPPPRPPTQPVGRWLSSCGRRFRDARWRSLLNHRQSVVEAVALGVTVIEEVALGGTVVEEVALQPSRNLRPVHVVGGSPGQADHRTDPRSASLASPAAIPVRASRTRMPPRSSRTRPTRRAGRGAGPACTRRRPGRCCAGGCAARGSTYSRRSTSGQSTQRCTRRASPQPAPIPARSEALVELLWTEVSRRSLALAPQPPSGGTVAV